MKFAKLAEYLEKLEKTSSRNQITEILAEVFKKANPSEIDKICYLLLGRIAPQHQGIEFNLAERMMFQVLAHAYDTDAKEIRKRFKQLGDLGDVSYELAEEKKKGKKLTVEQVYNRLLKVAQEGGGGSQERKVNKMADLLNDLDPLSSKYVSRIPPSNLRLGFSDITMLDALSVMETGDKSARKSLESAYNVTADIGKIAKRVKKEGLAGLERVEVEPGTPIRTSLAERLPSAEKIIEKVGPKVAVEPKYDGFRTQIHILAKGKVKEVIIFSRNHENVTHMFPDVVEAAKKLKIKDAILDAEAIGYNPETEEFVPFQETVQRKRKYGISEMAQQLPLKVFVFDVLYLNGKILMTEPFSKRRKILERTLKGKENTILPTEQTVVDDPSKLRELFDEYIEEGLEGILAKKLDVAYQAGGRGFHWVKFKRTTEGELSDTIDCVLIGAYRGRGKRAQFGFGGFLLGVPGKDEKIYTISNLGTGLTDEQFREMHKRVDNLKAKEKPKEYVVDKTVEPDVWVKPSLVLEILADEITLSPRHTAGRNKQGRGYSLRFPRLIKVREDKNPDQATSVAEVEKLYKQQKKK